MRGGAGCIFQEPLRPPEERPCRLLPARSGADSEGLMSCQERDREDCQGPPERRIAGNSGGHSDSRFGCRGGVKEGSMGQEFHRAQCWGGPQKAHYVDGWRPEFQWLRLSRDCQPLYFPSSERYPFRSVAWLPYSDVFRYRGWFCLDTSRAKAHSRSPIIACLKKFQELLSRAHGTMPPAPVVTATSESIQTGVANDPE